MGSSIQGRRQLVLAELRMCHQGVWANKSHVDWKKGKEARNEISLTPPHQAPGDLQHRGSINQRDWLSIQCDCHHHHHTRLTKHQQTWKPGEGKSTSFVPLPQSTLHCLFLVLWMSVLFYQLGGMLHIFIKSTSHLLLSFSRPFLKHQVVDEET